MTHTLTDAQSLTIADALTHTLTASDRRQRRIGDALFFRNPIRTERSGERMGSQPTHTLSASEMRYFPTISDPTARAVAPSVNPRQRRGHTHRRRCAAERRRRHTLAHLFENSVHLSHSFRIESQIQ